MNKQGKIWGETSLLFNKNNVEIHRIVGKDNTYCSKHKHEHKFNMFFVERGCLVVEIWKDYGLIDATVLTKGESCVVPPNQYHMFSIREDNTVAYEIYWVELSEEDIVREDVGGKNCE